MMSMMEKALIYANECNSMSWVVELPFIFRNPKPNMIHLYRNVGFEDWKPAMIEDALYWHFGKHFTTNQQGLYLFGNPIKECERKEATIHVRCYSRNAGYRNWYFKAA